MQDEVEQGAPDSTPDSPSPARNKKRRKFRWARWTTIERDLRREKGPLLAGVDEVGRGPIAGPVIACAVIMPAETRAIPGVDDSKRLTHEQRVRLAAKIRERAVAFALGAGSTAWRDGHDHGAQPRSRRSSGCGPGRCARHQCRSRSSGP